MHNPPTRHHHVSFSCVRPTQKQCPSKPNPQEPQHHKERTLGARLSARESACGPHTSKLCTSPAVGKRRLVVTFLQWCKGQPPWEPHCHEVFTVVTTCGVTQTSRVSQHALGFKSGYADQCPPQTAAKEAGGSTEAASVEPPRGQSPRTVT